MKVASINSMRAMFVALYGLSLPFVTFVGGAAFSDFGFRGCFDVEAVQCGDARAVMSIIVAYLLVGPIFWIGTGILRKRIIARGSERNA